MLDHEVLNTQIKVKIIWLLHFKKQNIFQFNVVFLGVSKSPVETYLLWPISDRWYRLC